MKIVFCTDLHGWPSLYHQLVGFCRSERPDVLLLGGDLLPDGPPSRALQVQTNFITEVLRPWREQLRDDLPSLRVLTVLGNHDWLAAAEAILRRPLVSHVWPITTVPTRASVAAAHARVGQIEISHAENSCVHNGHTSTDAVPADAVPTGQWCCPRVSATLEHAGPLEAAINTRMEPPTARQTSANMEPSLEWLSPNQPTTVSSADGLTVEVFGCSYVPATPFWVKDMERRDRPCDALRHCGRHAMVSRAGELIPVEPTEHLAGLPSIAEELSAVPIAAVEQAIWVSHAPPADTDADLMYGGAHVGSHAVREFIETRRPRVSLHGHIHEAPALSGNFASWLGCTLVINPGRSLHHLDAVVFDWVDPAATLRHSRLGRWRP